MDYWGHIFFLSSLSYANFNLRSNTLIFELYLRCLSDDNYINDLDCDLYAKITCVDFVAAVGSVIKHI